MSKPTMSRDGHRRVTLRIEWRADLIELAAALTTHLDFLGQDLPRSAREIRKCTSGALAAAGEEVALRLGDMLADDFDGELTQRYRQVVPAVARAFGFDDDEAAHALAAMLLESEHSPRGHDQCAPPSSCAASTTTSEREAAGGPLRPPAAHTNQV